MRTLDRLVGLMAKEASERPVDAYRVLAEPEEIAAASRIALLAAGGDAAATLAVRLKAPGAIPGSAGSSCSSG